MVTGVLKYRDQSLPVCPCKLVSRHLLEHSVFLIIINIHCTCFIAGSGDGTDSKCCRTCTPGSQGKRVRSTDSVNELELTISTHVRVLILFFILCFFLIKACHA